MRDEKGYAMGLTSKVYSTLLDPNFPTSSHFLEALYSQTPSLLPYLVAHPNLPYNLVKKCKEHESTDVRSVWAGRGDVAEEELLTAANNDRSVNVLITIAKRNDASNKLMHALALRDNIKVAWCLAQKKRLNIATALLVGKTLSKIEAYDFSEQNTLKLFILHHFRIISQLVMVSENITWIQAFIPVNHHMTLEAQQHIIKFLEKEGPPYKTLAKMTTYDRLYPEVQEKIGALLNKKYPEEFPYSIALILDQAASETNKNILETLINHPPVGFEEEIFAILQQNSTLDFEMAVKMINKLPDAKAAAAALKRLTFPEAMITAVARWPLLLDEKKKNSLTLTDKNTNGLSYDTVLLEALQRKIHTYSSAEIDKLEEHGFNFDDYILQLPWNTIEKGSEGLLKRVHNILEKHFTKSEHWEAFTVLAPPYAGSLADLISMTEKCI